MKKILSYAIKFFIIEILLLLLPLKCLMRSNQLYWPFLSWSFQSNFFLFLMMIWRLIWDIKKDKQQVFIYPKIFSILELLSMTNVTLTIVALFVQIINQEDISFSLINVMFYLLIPGLSIMNYLILENHYFFSSKYCFCCALGPLYYFFLMVICNSFDVVFNSSGHNSKYFPYPFMNYYDHGWFELSNKIMEIGYMFWIILFVLLSIGIGFLYYFLINKRMICEKEMQLHFLMIEDKN